MFREIASICLLVAALAGSARSVRIEIDDPIVDTCRSRESIDFEITDDILNNLHRNPEPYFENPETRCFATCLLTSNKTLKPDGTLNVEHLSKKVLKNNANRDEIIDALNDCSNEDTAGQDPCETAYKTAMCVSNSEVIRSELLHVEI